MPLNNPSVPEGQPHRSLARSAWMPGTKCLEKHPSEEPSHRIRDDRALLIPRGIQVNCTVHLYRLPFLRCIPCLWHRGRAMKPPWKILN